MNKPFKATAHSSRPLTEVVNIPKDPEESIEIDIDAFTQVDVTTVLEGMSLHITGNDFPEATLTRAAGQLHVRIAESHNPRYWEHKFHVRVYAQAMVNAVKILKADGAPVSDPQLDDDDYIGMHWTLILPATLHADEVLKCVKENHEAVRNGAEELLA